MARAGAGFPFGLNGVRLEESFWLNIAAYRKFSGNFGLIGL